MFRAQVERGGQDTKKELQRSAEESSVKSSTKYDLCTCVRKKKTQGKNRRKEEEEEEAPEFTQGLVS